MSTIVRGYKTELDLTNKQRTMCLQHAGCARFAYNWGLRVKQAARANGERIPSAMELHKRLNFFKATDFPWMYAVSKCAPQEALRDLDDAYKHAFRRYQEGKLGKKVGWPAFKSRHKGVGGFRLTGAIHLREKTIQLPRLGVLRLKEHGYLPGGAHVSQATVTEHAGRWYVSVQVTQEVPPPDPASGPVIGVDLGIKVLAVVSDGRQFPNPKAMHTRMKKLKRLSRWHSRKVKRSQNRHKAKAKLARFHAKIANIRQDCLHQTTTALVAKTKQPEQRPSVIGIEDLHIKGMLSNRKLSRAVADVGLSEFRRLLTYKAEFAGVQLHVVSRWEPSSKTCSCCGWVKEDLTLADRVFHCQECGMGMDRDLNAARNLELLAYCALLSTASYAGFYAYGQGSAGLLATGSETALSEVGTEH